MSLTTIDRIKLRDALMEIRGVEGETPHLISLELVLDTATRQETEIYVDHKDLEFLDVWL